MTENNQLMTISPWCVLQVNEATIIGYAPSWIFGSSLEAVEFLAVVTKYPLHDYPPSRFITSISIRCCSITIGLWGIST